LTRRLRQRGACAFPASFQTTGQQRTTMLVNAARIACARGVSFNKLSWMRTPAAATPPAAIRSGARLRAAGCRAGGHRLSGQVSRQIAAAAQGTLAHARSADRLARMETLSVGRTN